MLEIPPGKAKAMIYFAYTRGGSGGQQANKVFVANSRSSTAKSFQLMAPDGSYDGVLGRTSVDADPIRYALQVELGEGAMKIGVSSAEVGATGTPGTYSAEITFG